MALGQYVAGMGFSNVGLGVDHAMAHTLSAYYDMPHGKACATLLPAVMEYNAPATGEKYREIARAMGVAGVDEMTQEEYRRAAVNAVKQLAEDVGIVTSLKGVVNEADIPALSESAYAGRLPSRQPPRNKRRGDRRALPLAYVRGAKADKAVVSPHRRSPHKEAALPGGFFCVYVCMRCVVGRKCSAGHEAKYR